MVDRLDAPVLPHTGWNTVRPPAGTALLAGLDPATRFYFVHSYAAMSLPLQAEGRMKPRCTGTGGFSRGENGPCCR